VYLLFLGVAVLGLMANDAHDVGLVSLLINGIAHGFAVNREALIFSAIGFIPALEGAVEMHRISTDKSIPDDVRAGNNKTTVYVSAAETLARLGAKTVGPVRDGPVAAHPAQDCASGNGEYGGKSMAPSLDASWVRDIGKEFG